MNTIAVLSFCGTHFNELMSLAGFVGALVTAVQAFRNGARDRALEIAKTATAKVAVELVGENDDTKLEAAVTLVYDGLIELLKKESRVGPLAKVVVLALVPKTLVIETVKKAWHLYVKPVAEKTPA